MFKNPKQRAAFFAEKNKNPMGENQQSMIGGLTPKPITTPSPAADYINNPQKPMKFLKLRSMMGGKMPKV